MSFMFNPHPYDDPSAVNRPSLDSGTVGSIVTGAQEIARHLGQMLAGEAARGTVVIALDGYIGAQFTHTVNLISQHLRQAAIEVSAIDIRGLYKPGPRIDAELADNLKEDRTKDPVLLFGKLFKGGFEDLFDPVRLEAFRIETLRLKKDSTPRVVVVYGCGSSIRVLRPLYDFICWFDLSPKEAILRARRGAFANIGDTTARPVKALLRRCYYVDFEIAVHLRWELLKADAIDFYIDSTVPDDLKLLPRTAFNSILAALVKYPLRCKPVYLEGVWGGHYIRKLRHLPDSMRNCAWVFDLIPLEVSLVVEAGNKRLEFPFFTFAQKQGEGLMGSGCLRKFKGYFPLRFNYDDSYHSSGNMSIQVHSGHAYNIDNFGEHGRQDESYYVVATGHGAKTFIGFNEQADPDEFIREVKKSETEFTPVDYRKYVNHIDSRPGVQVLLPAGTIHSSGRNQVVLEIGSLTVGSYTYKLYDYLRPDLDGRPRPIHTYHGERVLEKGRKASWVQKNLVQKPRLVSQGEGWAEYIVGEHELLYFSLRRLEFDKSIEGDTQGRFHVLTLVDGEKVVVRSLENPGFCYTQNYLDVVVVPASLGKYVIENLGDQPVCVHKTMLKDGFENDSISGD